MKRFFKHKIVLIALAVICAVLLTSAVLTVFFDGTSVVHRVAGTIVSPFQKAFTAARNGVASFWNAQTRYDKLEEENEQLKDRVRELELLVRNASLYQEENALLRALLDMRQTYLHLQLETATIIAWNDIGWASTFTINKGSRDGIAVDQCVIVNDGIVGVVTSTAHSFSEVTTLIDSTFSTGALLSRTRISGVASGAFLAMQEGTLQLRLLPLDSDVKIGDEVVTSGIGDIFPPDLSIGTVTAVSVDPGGMSMTAVIAPHAALSGLKQVFIVTGYSLEETPASGGEGEQP